jgi:hypothetical protein
MFNQRNALIAGVSFLLGGMAALLSLSRTQNGMDPTISMAAARHAKTLASNAPWSSMQPARRAEHFMQPARAHNMQSDVEAKQGRRDLIAGVASGMATAGFTKAAFAVSGIDLKDDRPAVAKGFDIIYEARDLDLDQNVRDGLTQAREDPEFTKKRIAESGKRIQEEVVPNLKKAYWPAAIQSLRRQAGTLRFDLNSLANSKTGEEQKVALKMRKKFLTELEKLDYELKEKDMEGSLKQLPIAQAALDEALKVM